MAPKRKADDPDMDETDEFNDAEEAQQPQEVVLPDGTVIKLPQVGPVLTMGGPAMSRAANGAVV